MHMTMVHTPLPEASPTEGLFSLASAMALLGIEANAADFSTQYAAAQAGRTNGQMREWLRQTRDETADDVTELQKALAAARKAKDPDERDRIKGVLGELKSFQKDTVACIGYGECTTKLQPMPMPSKTLKELKREIRAVFKFDEGGFRIEIPDELFLEHQQVVWRFPAKRNGYPVRVALTHAMNSDENINEYTNQKHGYVGRFVTDGAGTVLDRLKALHYTIMDIPERAWEWKL